jgi:hypothetical protein
VGKGYRPVAGIDAVMDVGQTASRFNLIPNAPFLHQVQARKQDLVRAEHEFALPTKCGLALGVTAILQMLDFDEGIGVGVDHVRTDIQSRGRVARRYGSRLVPAVLATFGFSLQGSLSRICPERLTIFSRFTRFCAFATVSAGLQGDADDASELRHGRELRHLALG